MIGSRVSVRTSRGHRSELEEVAVSGTVTAVVTAPWGRDLVVELDGETMVGNPDHGPTKYLSVSVGSPLVTTL